MMFYSVVWLSFVGYCIAAPCTQVPECPEDTNCYATGASAMECISALPLNKEWANATLDVLTASLENFGFGALYHSTGPPYSINLDIEGELSSVYDIVNSNGFAADIDFQEYVQAIFTKTLDAHTRYHKPECYNAIFVQGFAFDIRVEEPIDESAVSQEPKIFLMENLYLHNYTSIYDTIDVSSYIGKEVLLLNGVEALTEISQWGDTHETRSNNRGIRFNAAFRSYLYRSSSDVNIVPLENLVITFTDGTSSTFPWLAKYTTGLGDVDVCAAEAPNKGLTSNSNSKVVADPRKLQSELLTVSPPLSHNRLQDTRTDRVTVIPSNSSTYVSCFTQRVDAADAHTDGISNVLVLKVASFSPPGDNYTEAWIEFLNDVETCLETDYEMIVVDVMGNGGGKRWSCLHLLDRFVIFKFRAITYTSEM